MSDHRPEHLDLCAAWALGSIDDADRARLEQHLARGCKECEAALVDFSDAAVLVASSAPPAAPQARLRDRVLGAAAVTPQVGDAPAAGRGPAPSSSMRSGRRAGARGAEFAKPRPAWQTWAPIAAAALAIVSAVLLFRTLRLAGEVSTARARMAQLERTMADEEKWAAVLRAPDARVSVLEVTTDGDPRLRARATYDPATRRAVVVFENFQKPMARDYQLWVIRDGTPANLGVIHAGEDGQATSHLEDVGDSFALTAFAVSLEPEGGSPNPQAPSGPVVMLGKLSG